MNELAFEFIGELRVDLEAPCLMGPTQYGVRNIYPVKSGRFEGPKVRAEVLPMGGDWLLVRSDGAGELDVRAHMRTDDGEYIYVTYRGIVLFTPEIMDRLSRGEVIPPEETYFRITPYFETASEKYSWLNKIVVVGTGQLLPGGVCYQLYKVK